MGIVAFLKKAAKDWLIIMSLLVPLSALKWLLWKIWGAEVIFVGLSMPMFLAFYYRGLIPGILATAIFTAVDYYLFELPAGWTWRGSHFLSLMVLVGAFIPVVAAFSIAWRNRLRDLQELARKLEEASKYRDLLLGTLGHDLRTPLTSVMAISHKLRLTSCDEAMLRRLDGSCKRMTRVIDQVLDMAQMHLGEGMRLSLSAFDLVELAKQAIDEVEMIFPKAKLYLQTEAETIKVRWDEIRISRTLVNLLTNACKYGDCEFPIILRIEEMNHIEIRILVHNEGAPIASELMPHLFTPFGRGRQFDGKLGLGLGLYITAEMVNKHGGRINVHSTEKEGTTFMVTIPRTAPVPPIKENN